MKVIKFYWEFHVTNSDFENNDDIKDLINEVRSGKFQREIVKEKHKTDNVKKCIATVEVLTK